MKSRGLQRNEITNVKDWLEANYYDEMVSSTTHENGRLSIAFKDGYTEMFVREVESNHTSLKDLVLTRNGKIVVISHKGWGS